MKKRFLIFVFVSVILFVMPVQIASARALKPMLNLSFEETTATCLVKVSGNTSSDIIKLEVKLWRGTQCIKTWSSNGKGSLLLEKSTTVTKGKTYKLTADVTINGVQSPTVSVSATCR